MNEELVLHILNTACYGLNLQFHLIPQAPYLYLFFDRAPDQVLDYPQLSENIRLAIASAGLPAEYEYLALYSRILGNEDPDWDTALYLYPENHPEAVATSEANAEVPETDDLDQPSAATEAPSEIAAEPGMAPELVEEQRIEAQPIEEQSPEPQADPPLETPLPEIPDPIESPGETLATDSGDSHPIPEQLEEPPVMDSAAPTADRPKDDFEDMAQFYFKAKSKAKPKPEAPQPPEEEAPSIASPETTDPAPPPPVSPSPATEELDRSQYCFIRNKMMLTSPIKPPTQEVVALIQDFHTLSPAEQSQSLPLLVAVFQQPDKKEGGDSNLYEPVQVDTQGLSDPLQAWFQTLVGLEPESFRKSAIWLSRYCANPTKAIADLGLAP